jgi:hypothetical protein
MIRLKNLLKESEELQQLPTEMKKHFLEIISTYGQHREGMSRKSDIRQVAETLGGIADAAQEYTLREGGDWFDRVTIKRNMSELKKLQSAFEKESLEARAQEQRLEALYEDMGNVLGRYFEIANVSEKVMKERLGRTSIQEAKKYDIGSGWMGNGLTIWNRAEEQYGDYKIIAHISKDGTLSIRDKKLPNDIKQMFQMWADTMKKGDRPGTY